MSGYGHTALNSISPPVKSRKREREGSLGPRLSPGGREGREPGTEARGGGYKAVAFYPVLFIGSLERLGMRLALVPVVLVISISHAIVISV